MRGRLAAGAIGVAASVALALAVVAVPLVPAESEAALSFHAQTVARGASAGPPAQAVLESLLERSGDAVGREQRAGVRALWRALGQRPTDRLRPHPATRRPDDPSLVHHVLSLTVPAPVSRRGPPLRLLPQPMS